MQPLEDSPLDHLHIDHERSSFLNSGDGEDEDSEEFPPPPMIDGGADPYLDYPDYNRTPTPPPSPGLPPFSPLRSTTPVYGKHRTDSFFHREGVRLSSLLG